ncbi:hypothetical protein J6590_002926 [Homalodisca vitripennis]|nr:hypothetical protein J6590_002926 [Homalodisca vitripennis]
MPKTTGHVLDHAVVKRDFHLSITPCGSYNRHLSHNTFHIINPETAIILEKLIDSVVHTPKLKRDHLLWTVMISPDLQQCHRKLASVKSLQCQPESCVMRDSQAP